MDTQKLIEEAKAAYNVACHALDENDRTYGAMCCIGTAVGKIPALLNEVGRLCEENNILRKMASAKTTCWLNPKEDCAIWEENTKLRAKIAQLETERDAAVEENEFRKNRELAAATGIWMMVMKTFGVPFVMRA